MISEIFKRLTNRQLKYAATLFFLGYMIFSQKIFFIEIRHFIKKLLVLYYSDWYYVLGFLIPSIFLLFLLRKSTKKFNLDWEKHYPDIERKESSETALIQTIVIDNHKENTREIRIYNPHNNDFKDLEGEVKLYENSFHFETIPFKIKHLEHRKGEKIILEDYNTKRKRFNEFHTFLTCGKMNGTDMEATRLYGTHFYKTHFLILNRCNFFLWWEYSWFKEKHKQILSWLRHQFTIPARYEHWGYWNFYRKRPWYYLWKLKGESWNYFFIRKLNQLKMILISLVLISILSFYCLSIVKLGKGFVINLVELI